MEPNSTAANTIDVDLDDRTDAPASEELVTDELLVEDVSIDGMCGVY